jgi:hypothetical protein
MRYTIDNVPRTTQVSCSGVLLKRVVWLDDVKNVYGEIVHDEHGKPVYGEIVHDEHGEPVVQNDVLVVRVVQAKKIEAHLDRALIVIHPVEDQPCNESSSLEAISPVVTEKARP